MKQKRYLFIALLAMMVQMAVASPVSLETAKYVGLQFLIENTQMKCLQTDDLQLVKIYWTENGTAAFYVFNIENGFVMISADDCAIPILGYSNESVFTVDNVPIQMEEYLQHFVEQIQYGIESQMVADERTVRQWELVQATGNIAEIKGATVVTPLLTDAWNQDCYYNNLCPVDANGPCGHVYAGCAATAFSQILHYWGFPSQGTGSHSYTPEGYPTQTVNFGATTYQWSNMPNALTASSPSAQINAVATLMWHCGVAIDMGYGPYGSGAIPSNVATALTSYFNYSSDLSVVYKANYDNSTWLNLIKNCLDLGRPIHYSGWNADSSSGHSFVCDGYDSNNMLHFNWGWSGYYNNYYALDALTPGNDNYSYNNLAIINIHPNLPSYQVTISANPSNGGSVSFNSKGGTDPDGITDGQWYYYDNGVNTDAIGTSGGNLWWGIMLPSGSFTGNTLTKVAAYDYMAMTGTASIYQGGTNAPAGAAIGTVNVTFTGSNQFVEFNFSNPVTINPQQNVWVVFYNGSGAAFPAAVCANTGDANGRWVSLDGSTWEDLTSYGIDYTFMVRAYIEQGGSGSSSAVYTEGQTCNVVATPNSGYTFTAWKENGNTVSTNANYSFTVTGNRNLVANFSTTPPPPQQYNISLSANPSNGGSVSGGGTYNQGASCTVHATANSGYSFVNWTENGTQVSTNANYTFTVTSNRNLVANFQAQPQQYNITVSANPSNGGSVSGGGTYSQGTTCTVRATANNGFLFTNWTENGTQVSTNANYTFTVTGSRNLVANFQAQPQQYNISVSANPSNGGSVSGGGTYSQGTTCTVRATANNGFLFTNWTENGTQVSTNATYSFTVTNNRNLVAHFAQSTYTIHASAGANGTITPSGAITVTHGASQSFAMIPDNDFMVQDVYIDGNSVGSMTSYTFTNVTADHYIHVTFVQLDGVEENNIISAVVYPNPTTGEFVIECENLKHISIVNAYGQTVYNADHEGNAVRIDLSSFAKGVYMMHIEAESGHAIRKIVVE